MYTLPESIIKGINAGQNVGKDLETFMQSLWNAHSYFGYDANNPQRQIGATVMFPDHKIVKVDRPLLIPPCIGVDLAHCTINNEGLGFGIAFWTPYGHGYHLGGRVQNGKVYSKMGGGIGLHPSVLGIEMNRVERMEIDVHKHALQIKPPPVRQADGSTTPNWAFGPFYGDIRIPNAGLGTQIVDVKSFYGEYSHINCRTHPRPGGITFLNQPLFNFEGTGFHHNSRYEPQGFNAPSVRFWGQGGDDVNLSAMHFESTHLGTAAHVEVDGIDLDVDVFRWFHRDARLVLKNGGRVTAIKRVEHRKDPAAILCGSGCVVSEAGKIIAQESQT